jgi:hypothetical protein
MQQPGTPSLNCSLVQGWEATNFDRLIPGNQYVYDDENRIVSVSLYLGGTASYSYDAEVHLVKFPSGRNDEKSRCVLQRKTM